MLEKDKVKSFEFMGHIIKKEDFKINFDITFDAFTQGFETDWKLDGVDLDLVTTDNIFNHVPFPLHHRYIHDYKQFFEPSNFYRNVVTICALAEKNINDVDKYKEFLQKYIEYALSYSSLHGKSRFALYNFDFKRIEYVIKAPWVSAIGSGFVIRALVRIYKLQKSSDLLELIRQYARPFLAIHSSKGPGVSKWFTWLDDDGYVWFDEYPGSDNIPSLVLNGHIHAMHAIHCFLTVLSESQEKEHYLDIYQAALTTIKYNTHKFRRPNNINRYSIREYNKDDYLPQRTVRQQRELYRVTGDRSFFTNAELFQRDIDSMN